MVSIVTWAVAGQAVFAALIPWIIAFGLPILMSGPSALWWVAIATACIAGYALAFGTGMAIHADSCDTARVGGIATWSLVVPALNGFVLVCAMMIGMLRSPIEGVVIGRIANASPSFLFAAVASYYLFWSTAVGATVAGYQATVC
jgi:hypothetical protein